MRIRWTSQALNNLDSAIDYNAANNRKKALKIAQKIWDIIQLLPGQPGLGRYGRVPGTRELVISGLPFIVPYAEYNGKLVILRIMHASMKWPESF